MQGTKLFQPIRMVVKHFFVPNFLNFSLKIVIISTAVSPSLDMSGTKLFQSIRRASALFCTKFEADASSGREVRAKIKVISWRCCERCELEGTLTSTAFCDLNRRDIFNQEA